MRNFNFFAIFGIVLLYTLPIIFGTSYYYDDLFRAYAGYTWSSDGRVFADLFYQLLTFNQTMPDTFPLALIISLFAFSYTGNLLSITYKTGDSVAFCIAYSMLIMSPLFVSNLLFRYDSSFMVLAVTASVLPYCLNKNKYINFILSTIFLVISFGLYQAAVSVFIAFAGIELLRNTIHGSFSTSATKCIKRLMQLIASYVIYSQIILKIFTINDYFNSFNKTIPINSDGMQHLMSNCLASLHHIKLMFSNGLIIAITPITILAILCALKYIIKSMNFISIIGLVGALLALIVAVPGIAIFGMNPIFFPRIYIGAGALFFFVCIIPIIFKINTKALIITQCILAVYFLGFINATVNAVRADVEYQKETSERIINTLDSFNLSTSHNFVIIGQLRQSPLSYVNSMTYPLIKIITPQHYINGYDGGRYMLMHHGLDNIEYVSKDKVDMYRNMVKSTKPIFSNNLYSIYDIDGVVVISFETTAYNEINKESIKYEFKNALVSDSHYNQRYFYTCVSNQLQPKLQLGEWYYLIFHMNNGENVNKNFYTPIYSTYENNTCISTKWTDPIDANNVKSIEFGIYNIHTIERRLDLGA
ncbi:glucosyltransferase domain-containing protein [Citrobacter werkmanii]|uniref:glucosyltransferase domain-containing protein n=1 Tax=Citrobacter werkmanii TaxID=67827 RepID=UPI001575B008|nr:glucosyltransferase domain-containing protein [Citrobacter werkmanii]NTY81327.1 hypothetical protein [Citrobacter werkmanii]